MTIVFDRKTDQTCAKQIVLDTGDGHTITQATCRSTARSRWR